MTQRDQIRERFVAAGANRRVRVAMTLTEARPPGMGLARNAHAGRLCGFHSFLDLVPWSLTFLYLLQILLGRYSASAEQTQG